MKKNHSVKPHQLLEKHRGKIIRYMKRITFIYLVFALSTSSFAFSQKISLNLGEVTLRKAFKEIEKKVDLEFFYNDGILDTDRKVIANYADIDVFMIIKKLVGNNYEIQLENEGVVLIVPKYNNIKEQQDIVIKGVVIDEFGVPVAGANVIVKDKPNKGVATDFDGNYKISVKAEKKLTLQFTALGFKTQEILIKDQRVVNVTMVQDISELDEVLISTGIIKRKASTFTGAVSTFNSEDLKRVSNSNVLESLRTLDPSLMTISNLSLGSDPNNLPNIQLRGTSTFDLDLQTDDSDIQGSYANSPNAPLFILDGFNANLEKILDLDMDRVESITILKDASAKAIYGSKAANGVVVIDTKMGAEGKTILRYDTSVSVEVPDLSSYNLMNAAEKLQFETDYGLYEGSLFSEDKGTDEQAFYQSKLRAVQEGVDTDWLSKPIENAVGTRHRLGFEYGKDGLSLAAGFSYRKTNGAMKGSNRENYSGDLSVSYRTGKVKIRNLLNITSNVSNDSPYGSFSEYARMNPYYSPYDEEGNLVEHPPLKISSNVRHFERYYVENPLWNSKLNTVLKNAYINISNNVYTEIAWTKNLRTFARFGLDLKTVKADKFYPADHTKFRKFTTEDLLWRKGSYQANEGESKSITSDINTSYSNLFGKHFVLVNLGTNLYTTQYEENSYQTEGFPSDQLNSIIFARQYKENTTPGGKEEVRREIGALGIVNYAYDDRFLFDASIRTSGSSEYGSNKRWGTFWSTGLGWNMHNEKWLENTDIQRLRLRGSIGTTGSQLLDAYSGTASYDYVLDRTYQNQYGLKLIGMRNDDLQWQRKFDQNIGVDLSVSNKLSFSLDFYNATTQNMSVSSITAPSTGFTSVNENAGEVLNRGYEYKIAYTPWSKPKDRSYLTLSFSAAHNSNKIKKLSNAMKNYNERVDALFNSDERTTTRPLNKYIEGVSLTSIWAVESKGIDPANGREIFVKKDGTQTYNYSAADQKVLGDRLPSLSGIIGTSFQYKGFGLNVSLSYSWGGQMYNYTLAERVEGYDIKYNVDRRVLDGAWSQVGDVKPYRANLNFLEFDYSDPDELNYVVTGSAPTGRFVFDNNELSLASVNLSYDFRTSKFIKKVGMQRLRLAVYGNNLHTWSSVEIERGTNYPFSRTFNLGLTATF